MITPAELRIQGGLPPSTFRELKEEVRCREHHEDSWWFTDKRCDKPRDHRGPHTSFVRTMYGIDETQFRTWRTGERGHFYVQK